MASTFELRQASTRQLDQLLPLVRAYHEFEGLDATDLQRRSAVQTLLANRALGGIWLIYRNGEAAGYIALCIGFSIEFGGHDAFIDEFYIRPEFRAQGLGGATLEQIKTVARNIGIKALHLEVAKTNIKAKQLYSRARFQARGKYELMTVKL